MSLTSTNRRSIDRNSSEPFYLQLADRLGEAIRSGVFQPGDGMPSESALCREWMLSRDTVRQALRRLEETGRIRLVPRRGAFVARPHLSGWVLQSTEGFFESEVDHDRRQVETEILEAREVALPLGAALALQLDEGATGFMLRRRRKLDGRFAVLSTNYLLPSLGDAVLNSEAMTPVGSLNRALRERVAAVGGARRTIDARPAEGDVAHLLDVPNGWPLLRITSVTWDQDERPFDHYVSWARTDLVKVTVEAMAVV